MFDSSLVGQRQQRIAKLQQLRDLGIDPYPAKSKKSHAVEDLVKDFNNLHNQSVTIVGRLMSWREHGQVVFGNLHDASGEIQLYIKKEELLDTSDEKQILGWDKLHLLDVGDHLETTGIVTKTQSGEISLLVKELRISSKSIRPLPSSWQGIVDKEERYRRRYLDMTLNPEIRERFVRRSKFWNAVRDFLNQNGFVEVNIPVLEHVTGGADARPFETYYDALDQTFYLRISHELPLKKLLGAGFEKVYDIGPRFRNEGFSDEHLPEHVAMEWYWAYADANDGMQFTRDMYRYIVREVYNTNTLQIRGFEVNLDAEWTEIDFVSVIRERFNVDVFKTTDEEMIRVLEENGVKLEGEVNRSRLVDSLWKLIRKTIPGPAFLTGVPKFLSPLAKSDPENPEVTQRFHPIIAGSELANAFGELNDPIDQLERFLEQQQMRDAGDDEAHMLDIDFVEMLEYGMPPAVGFGLSERVFWFFEDVTAKEGVPFPQLKHHVEDLTKKIYPMINFDEAEGKPNAKKGKKKTYTSANQDFDNRIIVVVNKDLPSWQMANTVAHVSAYLGNKLEEKFGTGENFVTQDGKNHPRNSQYAIVILAANPGQMSNFMGKVRETGLLYHGFIREMIETTNDAEIEKILADKKDDQIEYLGIGVYGDNETLKDITKKFSLWK
jgi:lysyl-tRNA synthetase class 2